MKSNMQYPYPPAAMTIRAKPAQKMGHQTRVGIASTVAQIKEHLADSKLMEPSECFYAAQVDCPDYIRQQIALAFRDRRIVGQPHFYHVLPEQAKALIELAVAGEASCPDLEPEPLTDRTHRKTTVPNFDFASLNVPIGAILTFVHDSTITCRVVQLNPPLVEYKGEIMELTPAAKLARNGQPSGPGLQNWIYQGETLLKRRRRLEGDVAAT